MAIVGGLIAYLADKMGSKIGKKECRYLACVQAYVHITYGTRRYYYCCSDYQCYGNSITECAHSFVRHGKNSAGA